MENEKVVVKYDSELDETLTTTKQTRFMLRLKLGCADSVLRRRISELRKTQPILWSNHEMGYRKAKPIASLTTLVDAQKEYAEVAACIADIMSKQETYNQQLRPLIAYKEILQKAMEGMA